MKDFLLDLLHDLREKRMAPVAIVLLVALVAVPLVLTKPGDGDGKAEEPAADQATAAEAGSGQGLVQTVEEGPSAGDSDLSVFHPKDPFKSAVRARRPGPRDGVAQLVSPSVGSSSPGIGSGSAPAPSGGGGANVSPPSTTPSPGVVRRVTKAYTYVVDLRFGPTGDERLRRGVRRLGILPSDRDPLVVFLGVSSDARRAVFMVDSRASQSGEGTCRPSLKTCTFLYLRAEQDHDEQFVSDATGREYHMTLLDIRRVEVKRSPRNASRRRVRASAAAGAGTRVVTFPSLAPDEER